MIRAAIIAALALIAPTAAATDRAALEACLEEGGIDACYGLIAEPCVAAAPAPTDETPLFQWKVNDRACWAEEHAVWDALLNDAYRALLDAVGALSPNAPAALRTAQRAWIAFRDGECAWPATFLRQNNLHHHELSCATRMTAERAIFLRSEVEQWRDW